MWLTRCGACALAYSSWKITCCISDASRPYGAGQPMPDPAVLAEQPLPRAASSKPSCSRPGPPAPPSVGELADQMRLEPVAHLGAKRLVLGREPQVHVATVLCSGSNVTTRQICIPRTYGGRGDRPDDGRANGLTFGARTCGDEGPLALCLHGFPDSAHTWDHLLPELAAAGFRAVAPWTRGYAPTDVPADGDYSGSGADRRRRTRLHERTRR